MQWLVSYMISVNPYRKCWEANILNYKNKKTEAQGVCTDFSKVELEIETHYFLALKPISFHFIHMPDFHSMQSSGVKKKYIIITSFAQKPLTLESCALTLPLDLLEIKFLLNCKCCQGKGCLHLIKWGLGML